MNTKKSVLNNQEHSEAKLTMNKLEYQIPPGGIGGE